MKIELRDLMDKREMLSHIFLGCIPKEKLIEIKEKYVGKSGEEKDWSKESVKIAVEMKIAGVSINPKNFFDNWKDQMQRIISERAQELVKDKLGSGKLQDMQYRLNEYEQILKSWESEINWKVKNPFIDDEDEKTDEIENENVDKEILTVKEVAAKYGEEIECMFLDYGGKWITTKLKVNSSLIKDMEYGSIKECRCIK